MKEENKVVRAAKEAKKEGYQYMIALVREIFHTKYYNVIPLDIVIKNGRWTGLYPTSRGTTESKLPQGCIKKKEALKKYCK